MPKANRLTNTSLILGAIIVGFSLFIAISGSSLAPRNPLEEKVVMAVDGEWFTAPFPPFLVPEFPLGTDSLGRDVLSQVLWALRPTLTLVGYVAILRLFTGALLGMLAGWHNNQFGSVMNGLINTALSIPTLIVALAVVALAGAAGQPWGFVLGLSLTGWADSARIVREQTRIARQQVFVEASRALGHSNFGIVINHVLRQILPYVWMLLTFEISSTLLITAGLGFLGYYAGGEVWIWISDTAAARYSGMPELGQMLSGVNEDIYTSPWKLFTAGTMLFVTVLGFNLLGEGLRRIANSGAHSSRLRELVNQLGWHIDEHFSIPLKRKIVAHPLISVLVFAMIASVTILSINPVVQLLKPEAIMYPVPGGHLWASQWHDPSATMWTNAPGVNSPVLLWQFNEENGFSGGPAVAADGSVYLLSKKGTLYSITPQGEINWSASIPADAVGSPALDADGNIYITDMQGGLSSFTPGGDLRWRFQPENSFEATSGPVVSPNGTIYYVVIGDIRAFSPGGEMLWQTAAFTRRVLFTPIISPAENFVFLRDTIIDASNGSVIKFDSLPTAEQYIVGLNGLLYLRFESKMTGWEYVRGEAQPRDHIELSRTAFFGWPGLVGVLPDGTIWMHYNSQYEDSNLIWLDKDGNLINRAHYAYRPSVIAGIDEEFVFYICGAMQDGIECAAVSMGAKDPRWTFTLEDGNTVSGTALIPGRLYVATDDGFFYAIGDLEK